jgi:hypothetical protein
VNNAAGIDADFTTLQAAVDAASTGDTIYVEGSVDRYDGNGTVDITKQLVLIGPGYYLGENDATQADLLSANFNRIDFESGSEGSVMMGLVVDYCYLFVNSITVRRNNFYDLYPRGENAIIIQNYLRRYINTNNAEGIIANNISGGLLLDNQSSFIIRNNLVYLNYNNNIYNSEIQNNIIASGSIPSISERNNTVFNNLFHYDGSLDNGNQFSVDMSTVYVGEGSTDGRFQLTENSPAKGAGLDELDCGPFGGSQSYVLSGIPPGPSIYQVVAPVTAPKNEGLPVTIKIRSNN